MLRIHQVAEQLGVSTSSVRLYVKSGKLECSHTPSGQRVFSQEQVDAFLGKAEEIATVFYVRSSTGDNKLLKNQEETLRTVYGEPLKVYSDKGSGLNENRKGLERLMKGAKNKEFNRICITHKDRLARFGYKYLQDHLSSLGVSVTILSDINDKNSYDELLQDFMSLIASFSGKFYRLRGYEQKKQLLKKAGEELEKNHHQH